MDNLYTFKSVLAPQKQRLLNVYHLKSIGFFGSVVRNDFNEKSDIDIIVEFTKPVGIEFIDLADELEKILKRRIDLVSRKGLRDERFLYIKDEIQYV